MLTNNATRGWSQNGSTCLSVLGETILLCTSLLYQVPTVLDLKRFTRRMGNSFETPSCTRRHQQSPPNTHVFVVACLIIVLHHPLTRKSISTALQPPDGQAGDLVIATYHQLTDVA